MRRSALLVVALATALLLAATPAAASPRVEFPSLIAGFDLRANHGLRAHVQVYDDWLTLVVERKHRSVAYRSVTYEVPVESSEAGLRARFGKLGQIDVVFKPTKTLRTEPPPDGCEGEPSTQLEGLFIGTIAFTGEREYVRIEAGRAKGEMSVSHESEWKCPRSKGPPRIRPPRPSPLIAYAESEAEEEPAILSVFKRGNRCLLMVFTNSDERGRRVTGFLSMKLESREGMKIDRQVLAVAGASAFVYDHAAGTARVRPPQPFTGRGIFKRRPHRRDLWRSTIRVPFLGIEPVRVRGRSFRASLRSDQFGV